MARQLRVQYPGALYHVINRGNYRHDVFRTTGAINAFYRTLVQTCERHEWLVHAYVIMRNHYHLALETPLPNLADGMQWLQATFAARFNHFRAKAGHFFQGRYKALLVQDSAALVRVVNYVHLNPVRAKTDRDIATDPKGARWKIEVAAHLRREVAAPYRWIAASLNMGSPLAIRVNVCRLANG